MSCRYNMTMQLGKVIMTHAWHHPRGSIRLKQADHQPTSLGTNVPGDCHMSKIVSRVSLRRGLFTDTKIREIWKQQMVFHEGSITNDESTHAGLRSIFSSLRLRLKEIIHHNKRNNRVKRKSTYAWRHALTDSKKIIQYNRILE